MLINTKYDIKFFLENCYKNVENCIFKEGFKFEQKNKVQKQNNIE
jgi:hypothetical protein